MKTFYLPFYVIVHLLGFGHVLTFGTKTNAIAIPIPIPITIAIVNVLCVTWLLIVSWRSAQTVGNSSDDLFLDSII